MIPQHPAAKHRIGRATAAFAVRTKTTSHGTVRGSVRWRALILVCAVAALPATVQPSRGVAAQTASVGTAQIVEIGPSGSVTAPEPSGLNDSGVVDGTATVGGFDRAFRWANGTYSLLQPLPTDVQSAIESGPHSIDNAGDVVGGSSGVATSPYANQAVLWPAGSTTPTGLGFLFIGSQAETDSYGTAVNASGTIVGWSSPPPPCGGYCLHVALFSAGGSPVDLGLGNDAPYPYDINKSGTVLFQYDSSAPSNPSAYAVDSGGTVTIDPCPGGYAMNDSGLVVGSTGSGPTLKPAYWTGSGSCHLFALPGGESTGEAVAVNNKGEATGFTSNHATMWKADGTPVNLNTLLPPNSGWFLVGGIAINNAGQILGDGLLNGSFTYFLLTPGQAANGLVVNSPGDLPDTNTSDGVCHTGQTVTVNNQQAPECTLRAAIQESNARQAAGKGPQTITFGIPGPAFNLAIVLHTPLPSVDGTTTIDASTEPGVSVSRVNYTFAAFDLDGQGSTIRGLSIYGNLDSVIVEGSGEHKLFADHINGEVRIRSGGNTIGAGAAPTQIDGCAGDCNSLDDVLISAGQGNTVVGNVVQGGLLISGGLGSVVAGNLFSSPGVPVGNPFGISVIGGSGTVIGPGNIVVNERSGIVLDGPATVKGNDIGVYPSGQPQVPCSPSQPLSINQRGILVEAPGEIIGGPNPGDGNVVSGWGVNCSATASGRPLGGIVMVGATGALIEGNLVGTDPTGSAADANSAGVLLGGVTSDTVVRDNVISGNVYGLDNLTDSQVQITGNRIGTNKAGDTAIPNQFGVDAWVGTVGGPRPPSSTGCVSPCNLISGNDVGVRGAVVEGNFIGTSLDGSSPIPNRVGVSHTPANLHAVDQIGAPDLAVYSGVCESVCNLIEFNQYGIELGTPHVLGGQGPATIEGNLIANNTQEGVGIGPNGQPDGTTTIGGPNVGDGNVISSNGAQGVLVGAQGAPGITHVQIMRNQITRNTDEGVLIANSRNVFGIDVRMNAISGNGRLGIDLSIAPTINLTFQGDGPSPSSGFGFGPNHLQDVPTISSAVKTRSSLVISGHQNFPKGTGPLPESVDIYADASCDPSGYGEGAVYLGTTSIDFHGHFNATLPLPPAGMKSITATFTGPDGSTSEFSRCTALH